MLINKNIKYCKLLVAPAIEAKRFLSKRPFVQIDEAPPPNQNDLSNTEFNTPHVFSPHPLLLYNFTF